MMRQTGHHLFPPFIRICPQSRRETASLPRVNNVLKNPTTSSDVPSLKSLSLDEQLTAFRHNRFLAMPITGAIVWAGIGIAGMFLPAQLAVLSVYIGTGLIFYLALGVAKLVGEDLLARGRKGNLFDRIFLLSIAMSCLVFSIAIPFGLADPTSVPLSVGVLTGLMWLPFSAMAGHWVGYFHAIARTLLLVAAWYLFPGYRFVALPAVIVAVYIVSMIALARRWAVIQNSSPRSND